MSSSETITDYITGEETPNIGAEMNRQAVERFLVEKKGYDKTDIIVGLPIQITVQGETYDSRLDLAVQLNEKIVMVVKCAAGSLGSWERQTLAGARLALDYQIPFSIISDGRTALVRDTETGEKIGEGLETLPSKAEILNKFKNLSFTPFPAGKHTREKLIFKSYDSMSVHTR